jgi:hypothetical protein
LKRYIVITTRKVGNMNSKFYASAVIGFGSFWSNPNFH